jgi:hypothetical protein
MDVFAIKGFGKTTDRHTPQPALMIGNMTYAASIRKSPVNCVE